jgi:hypothetical protein
VRQYYIKTQEANKLKNNADIFSYSAFSRLLERFCPKKCHFLVMERDNLTIPTDKSSYDAKLKSKRLLSKIFLNSALSDVKK